MRVTLTVFGTCVLNQPRHPDTPASDVFAQTNLVQYNTASMAKILFNLKAVLSPSDMSTLLTLESMVFLH